MEAMSDNLNYNQNYTWNDYVVYCNVLGDYYTGKSSLISSVFGNNMFVTIADANSDELSARLTITYGTAQDLFSHRYRNILEGNFHGASGNGSYSITYDASNRLLLDETVDFLSQYETQQKFGIRDPRTKPKASCMHRYLLNRSVNTDSTYIIFCCNEQRGGEFHRNYKLVIDQYNTTHIHDGDNGLVNGWYPHPIRDEESDGVLAKIRDNESNLGKQFIAYDLFFVVYDITRRESFAVAEKLLEDIAVNRHNNRKYIAFLVGNHADMYLDAKYREVPFEDGERLASKYSCSFYETSTWDNTNIGKLSTHVFQSVYAELDKLFVSEQNIKAANDDKVESGTEHLVEAAVERQSSAQLSQCRENGVSDPDASTNAAPTTSTNPSMMSQMSLPELSRGLSQDLSPRSAEDTGVSTPVVETFYCNICLENVAATMSLSASACEKGHVHCKPCIAGYLCSAIENGDIIFCCPGRDIVSNHGCMATFNDAEIKMYSSDELFSKYQRFRDIKTNTKFRECPKCKEGYVGDPEHPAITCVKCNTVYCFFHNDAHPAQSCTDYAAYMRKEHKMEEERSEQVVKLSKNCPKCKSPTIKNGGCNHMTCVCRSDWCWICNNEIQDVTEHYSSGPCSGQQFIGYYDDLPANQRACMYCHTFLLRAFLTICDLPMRAIADADLALIDLLPTCITQNECVENYNLVDIGPLTLLVQLLAFIGAIVVTILSSPFSVVAFFWHNRHGRVLNYRLYRYVWLPAQYFFFDFPLRYDYFLLQMDHVPLETWQVLGHQLNIKIRADKLLLEVLKAEVRSGNSLVHANHRTVTPSLISDIQNLESDLLRQVNENISIRTLQREALTASGSNNV